MSLSSCSFTTPEQIMQSSFPATSFQRFRLELGSGLLRRLFEWNENLRYDKRCSDAVEMALFRDLVRASGTDLDLIPESYGPPEAIARTALKAAWTTLSGLTDVQELRRDMDSKERLVARAVRGDFVPDIHRAEDAAIAQQLKAMHGESSLKS